MCLKNEVLCRVRRQRRPRGRSQHHVKIFMVHCMGARKGEQEQWSEREGIEADARWSPPVALVSNDDFEVKLLVPACQLGFVHGSGDTGDGDDSGVDGDGDVDEDDDCDGDGNGGSVDGSDGDDGDCDGVGNGNSVDGGDHGDDDGDGNGDSVGGSGGDGVNGDDDGDCDSGGNSDGGDGCAGSSQSST